MMLPIIKKYNIFENSKGTIELGHIVLKSELNNVK
jgi:hypothetical protein